jgi:hypothetical protein
MSPLSPPALRALLFTAAFSAGALLLRTLEAHACPPPCADTQGERLTLRVVASRVDGVPLPLPAPDAGVPFFEVANDWSEPEAQYASARLYDPEHPDTPRERVLWRQP